MFWECQELDTCETFTGGLPLLMKDQFGGSKRLLTEAGDFHKIRWIPIVRSYSGRSLTVPSDKAVAFAGIVEELQASSDSSYFAGFWRKGLERQLLWKVPHETFAERPPTYQAPSWSWFSINGTVELSDPWAQGTSYKPTVILEILHAKVQLASDSDLGPIKSGHIYARGILKAAFWDGTTIIGLEELLKETCGAMTSSDIWIDEGARQRDHDLMCMPVLYQV